MQRTRSLSKKLTRSAIVPAIAAMTLAATAVPSFAASSTTNLTLFEPEGNPPYPYQITAFEKAYPNIHITVNQVPFAQFYTKTAVLASSSSPPDLYDVDDPTLANLAAAGVLKPLTGLVPASYFNTLTSTARKALSYDGKYYSSGPIDTALALYYNKSLTSKAGINPPTTVKGVWTWAQAEKAMKSCEQGPANNPTVYGLAPTEFGNGTPGFDYYSTLFLRSAGSPKAAAGSSALKTFQAIAPNGSTVDGYLNSPQSIAGATVYQKLYTEKISPPTGNPNSFIDGQSCFEFNTSNFIQSLNQAKVKFKWGVTPWPYITTPIVHTGSTEIAIGAKTKNLAAAVDFVKFDSSVAQQTKEVQTEGYLPVIKSLYSSMPLLQTYPWTIFTGELADWGEPRPVTPHYLQYSNLVTTAMRNIAYGSSPTSQLNTAASQLDQLLKQPAGQL